MIEITNRWQRSPAESFITCMRPLHWHTKNHPCVLLGWEVGPRRWQGGMMENLYPKQKDSTGQVAHVIGNASQSTWRHNHRPLWPPFGWGGATEEQIWEEMVGSTKNAIFLHGGLIMITVDGSVFLNEPQGYKLADSTTFASLNGALANARNFMSRLRNPEIHKSHVHG